MVHGPKTVMEATGEAVGATIGGMFDIPEFGIEDQMADAFTLGSESYETEKLDTTTGETNTSSDDSWDPFAGW